MSITINYQDQDGNPTTLYKLVRTEPDWAASRINFMNNKIAELEKQAEEFKVVVSYLDAKITSASNCHERAVPFLLSEALERSHLDFHREALKGRAL
jgi:alpha-ketoglutarate-dependent taurine dioxygenase